MGKLLLCCCFGRRQSFNSGQPATHSEFVSTASFSGEDHRRLSRASISSSLPSSGRNSVVTPHSPFLGGNSISVSGSASRPQHHRSFSAAPSPPLAGNGSSHRRSLNSTASTTNGTGEVNSVSLQGTPRAQFRSSLEKQQARSVADYIKEESESNAENAAELAVFAEATCQSAHLKEHSSPVKGATTAETILVDSCLRLPSVGTPTKHNHHNHHHQANTRNGGKRSNSVFSFVTRLVTRGGKEGVPQERRKKKKVAIANI